MTYQLDTEDWKEFRKELQEKKSVRRDKHTTEIFKFCVENSINVETKTAYHFRLTREPFTTVDVFPTSSKVRILKTGSKFIKTSIIKFLINHFK